MAPSATSNNRRIELQTKAIGFELFSEAEEKEHSILESQWWEDQILEWCMNNEDMKTQLLRFVDVFPSLRTPRQLAAHLSQYFPRSNRSFPAFLRIGIDLSLPTSITRSVLAREVRSMMTRMAHRFISGATIEEAIEILKEIRNEGQTFTLDLLGEAVVSEQEADNYLNAYIDALHTLSSKWEGIESQAPQNDTPNISLKLSSLYSQFDPVDEAGSKECVKKRLREVFRAAKKTNAFIFIDMEQYALCELTIQTFCEFLNEDEFRDFPDTGIVLQAYLRESEIQLCNLLKWVKERGTPITVRLVKGAYWDYELVHARQMGWPLPVFTSKAETDANFERLARILLEQSHMVRTAIGSHNIRTIAHSMATAKMLGVEPSKVEFQMLYGMGDPIKRAILKTDFPLRIYTPFGDLIPGMAYLVRRILENTSNESFLRQDFFAGLSAEELLKNPAEAVPEEAAEQSPSGRKTVQRKDGFINEPVTDFSRKESRGRMKSALTEVHTWLDRSYPMLIGGQEVTDTSMAISINPSHTDQVVGRIAQASTAHVEDALLNARSAFERWQHTTPGDRAELLFRVADVMAHKRFHLAALEVYEVGKTWTEADADVVEAIDFLRYYGAEMLRLGGTHSTTRLSGEKNEYLYRPRGVGAIIAPWNFPLAILTGMSSAAIAAGNTIIVKPAPQSPIMAVHLARIFMEAGIPPGVLNLVAGPGETIGEYLVKSPDIDFVTFTGSQEVGERINRLAAEYPSRNGIKKVVAEMGGKNAIIIDESADFDSAIVGVLGSAFGYQGQKCSAASRIILLEAVYDSFLARLVEAAESLTVGPAEDPSTRIGPVIDEEAYEKILGFVEKGKQESRLVLESDVSHLENGFFIGPTIFAEVPLESSLAQREIFGPVLAVLRCTTFDEAIHIANASSFALTGGVYSRTPEHIAQARREFLVGNLYINRKITGAIVQRQPFGGFKMSGIGSKAGGPDYLIQFMLPQTITENTMRHGFAPLEEA